MKKWLVVLCLMLALLMGSALADTTYTVTITGVDFQVSANIPVAYAEATTSGDSTVISPSDASNYNIKLELSGNKLTLTLNNATLKSSVEATISYSGDLPLTIYGIGTNVIENSSSEESAAAIYCNNLLTLDGSFQSILGKGNYGILANAFNYTQESRLVIAKGAHIGDISGKSTAIDVGSPKVPISGRPNILIEGQIDSIGKNVKPEGGICSEYSVEITGSIGAIDATRTGIRTLRESGNIQIDGTIGNITVSNTEGASVAGIYTPAKIIINNSVGPIIASFEPINTYSSVQSIYAEKGIVLGSGVYIALPENGKIATKKTFVNETYYTVVSSGEDTTATNVQFVKGAASAPETGDSMNLVLWASLLTLSLVGIAVFTRRAKREY